MSNSIHPVEILHATDAIRVFIESHDHKSFMHEFGEYVVYTTELAKPRAIGERKANFLRVFKSLSGGTVAGAVYTEHGLEPHPETRIAQEMPLRYIAISAEAPPTYAYNGSDMDARDYPLTAFMLTELLDDIRTAL
jgi:hypothetical protein